MNIKSITIAGTNSGCGKTTISTGIMAALVDMGFKVQPFKVGPDYIDPMFHTFITGNPSRNLDTWILDEKTVREIYTKNSWKADISIVEGVMGFYDGFGGTSILGSTAHVSKVINSPVVLVVNGEGASLSIVPLIKGFMDFCKEVDIRGVIINGVNSEGHYQLLKNSIEKLLPIEVLGYMPFIKDCEIKSRHLGLIPQGEICDLKAKMNKLSTQVKKTIDIEKLLKISQESFQTVNVNGSGNEEQKVLNKEVKNTIELSASISPSTMKREESKNWIGVRIAVAKDNAFNFYYRDNLEFLESMGVELAYFSPLKDKELPEEIHGLYIGGGYPEVFGKELSNNRAIRENIKSVIKNGLPTYAECGGLMYLGESIYDRELNCFEMVGVIPLSTKMTDRLRRFGYVDIEVTDSNVVSKKGDKIRAHEFHYSHVEMTKEVPTCFRVLKSRPDMPIKEWNCGYKVYNLIAGYPHIHFLSNKSFAMEFVKNCEDYKMERFK